jgi:hypothetical protein
LSAATDLLSLADAQAAVRLSASNTIHAARLEGYVTAVSLAIDELVGPVVRRTVTGEQHPGGCGHVRLRRTPISSVTTVKVWDAGISTTLTGETLSVAGGYLAEQDGDDPTLLSGTLRRRSSWTSILWEYGTVEVTYVAGRYATTSAVRGSRFHTAAVLTLKSMWQGETDTVAVVGEYEQPISAFPRVVIPQAAKDLLSDQIQYRGLA